MLTHTHNERSSNKSSFAWYLSLSWPVCQSRAAVEPNLRLSQNTPISWYTYHYTWIFIWWYVNWVMVFKFLVYSLNKTQHTLLYVISLWQVLRAYCPKYTMSTEDGRSMSVFLLYWQTSQSRMADSPAFIASKSFDLWNHNIPQMKWHNLRHILMY